MLKVMLVDDSPIVRGLLRGLLGATKAVSITGEFANPKDAINAITRDPPELILLDIQLENGSGMEVLEFVMANYPHIKVMVVSNHSDNLFRKHYISNGAYRFFDKSAELDALGKNVAELALAQSQPQAEFPALTSTFTSTPTCAISNENIKYNCSDDDASKELNNILFAAPSRKTPIMQGKPLNHEEAAPCENYDYCISNSNLSASEKRGN